MAYDNPHCPLEDKDKDNGKDKGNDKDKDKITYIFENDMTQGYQI